jgi:hypothetical protein
VEWGLEQDEKGVYRLDEETADALYFVSGSGVNAAEIDLGEATATWSPLKVWNKRRGYPRHAVYVGRPSPFGNPFVIGVDGDRDEVVMKYAEMLSEDEELSSRVRSELRGKDLVCWCTPLRCHAEILLKVANE